MCKKLMKILLCLFLCVFSANGCITFTKSISSSKTALLISGSIENSPSHYYIQNVPFIRQKGNLCGPAALSAIFKYYGKDISQEKIAKDIYLIPVHGVLNIDLENYAKNQGYWTYISSDKEISKIKETIRRNIPVLVLVRASRIPFRKSYHYLVLLGYEDEGELFVAHSGKRPNEIIPYRTFLKNWAEAEFWSLLACPKEEINWDLDAQGYNNLGLLYEKQGKLELAIQNYEQSLNKSREPETLFNLGNAYLKNKSYTEAISYYKEAVGLNPEFADCYNNLAYTYMEENLDLNEAMNYVEQALRLKPSNKVYYLDTLGMIQFKKGLLREAAKSFEEASELAVDKKVSSLIYYHLGLVKLKAGSLEEAKKILQKSVELDSQSEAKEALKELL